VVIEAYSFDIDYQLFASHQIQTDAQGNGAFSVQLPDYLVGTALDQGRGHVRLDLTVTDLTQHAQTKTLTVPVVTEDLSVVFFAEGDRRYDGQDNRFYLLVSDPSGRPVEADAVATLDGIIYQARTAQNGLATLVHPVTGP